MKKNQAPIKGTFSPIPYYSCDNRLLVDIPDSIIQDIKSVCEMAIVRYGDKSVMGKPSARVLKHFNEYFNYVEKSK